MGDLEEEEDDDSAFVFVFFKGQCLWWGFLYVASIWLPIAMYLHLLQSYEGVAAAAAAAAVSRSVPLPVAPAGEDMLDFGDLRTCLRYRPALVLAFSLLPTRLLDERPMPLLLYRWRIVWDSVLSRGGCGREAPFLSYLLHSCLGCMVRTRRRCSFFERKTLSLGKGLRHLLCKCVSFCRRPAFKKISKSATSLTMTE